MVLFALLWSHGAWCEWPTDPSQNFPVCAVPNAYTDYVASCSDGAGGVIFAFYFSGGTPNDGLRVQRISADGVAQWALNGVKINQTIDADDPALIPDGAGGAIVAWSEWNAVTQQDILVQRIDANGARLWALAGVVLCNAPQDQSHVQLCTDGVGGAIVAWEDYRNGVTTRNDIYARRVTSAGVAMWTPNGVPICTAANTQYDAKIVPDGASGAVLTWTESRLGGGPFVQRINSSGVVQWAANGISLSVFGNGSVPAIVESADGGAILAWYDGRAGGTTQQLFAQRVNGAGALQWTANGVLLLSDPIGWAQSMGFFPVLTTDGGSGGIALWSASTNGGGAGLYAQRITVGGAPLWGAQGAALVEGSLSAQPAAIADGFGGAFASWPDGRGGGSNHLYAQRVGGNGENLWGPGGVVVTTSQVRCCQYIDDPVITLGAGGAIIGWIDMRSAPDAFQIYAQMVRLSGLLGSPVVTISEIRTDQPGPDPDEDEYFELVGPPGTGLDGLSYIVIGDGPGGGCGIVESVTPLAGLAIQPDGFLAVCGSANGCLDGCDIVDESIDFEDGDNVTHLLVAGFAGVVGADLDMNDDGILDVTPWTAVEDYVGFVANAAAPNCAITEFVYCPVRVGPDGVFAPGHVVRAPGEDAWQICSCDPAADQDTPGAANGACAATGAGCGAGAQCGLERPQLADAIRVGDELGGQAPQQAKVQQDQAWIADWNFDGQACASGGWVAEATAGGAGTVHLLQHVTDNDRCTENTTCAWIFTDPAAPTPACAPEMAYGPGGATLTPGLDELLIGPPVTLQTTPNANRTVLDWNMFPGNSFAGARIVLNWSVSSSQTGAAGPWLPWEHAQEFNTLDGWTWGTRRVDLTPHIPLGATHIRVRFRVADWGPGGLGYGSPGSECGPEPGPYIDRVRIGRSILSGPVISEGVDSRSQAQDCFPTEPHPLLPPGHFRPSADLFGTCAFSSGEDELPGGPSPEVATHDAVHVRVVDARGAGGIAVTWYGAIVAGPHMGKSPPGTVVGGNGFFAVVPAVDGDRYSVSLDDTYFRGGDVLLYFWAATDALGGFTSDPAGLTGIPLSVAMAEQATGGLLEVSFLPTIDWAPEYLARIAADPHGDLDPTPAEIASSAPSACLLYVNHMNPRRRSGDANRTSFMYTLDNLGYRGYYDVYDHQGMGNTNNHLGGRATVEQVQGYSLIVYDAGNRVPGPIMPDGADLETAKVDQATWFRSWLAQASSSPAGFGTLWVMGSNVLEERATNPLYAIDMGVTLASANQQVSLTPNVAGQSAFTFDKGAGVANADFTAGNRALFSLAGGCPETRNYDGLSSAGTAVRVYRYRAPGSGFLGAGAVVMNRNDVANWNTILMSFPWFDIRDASLQAPYPPPDSPPPALDLARTILEAVLPSACLRSPQPTDMDEQPPGGVPPRTVLHQNVPNPFNPVTTIRFELANDAEARLEIYDTAGRRIRTLAQGRVPRGLHHVMWDGEDDRGRRVASGIYYYRLRAEAFDATKRLVLLK